VIPIKIVTVNANGKRFILTSDEGKKVRVRGEVQRYSGLSAVHGPDKVFMADRVKISDVEYDEALLESLCAETNAVDVAALRVEEENKASILKQEKQLKRERKKFLNEGASYDGRQTRTLTEYADQYFKKMGYDYAMDQLGNGLDENMLADAAIDIAAYESKLSSFGVKEGGDVNLRESAADMIHEGMLKALEEKTK
jgi:hypothetical protein